MALPHPLPEELNALMARRFHLLGEPILARRKDGTRVHLAARRRDSATDGRPPHPEPCSRRVHALLVAAAARLTGGCPADEYLQLAHLACELPVDHPDAPVGASVRELLERHAAYMATNPPRRGPRVPGIRLIFVAAAVARSPALPQPLAIRSRR